LADNEQRKSNFHDFHGQIRRIDLPWRQSTGNTIVSLVNFHTNATSKRWHLWEVDLRFASGLPPGWLYLVQGDDTTEADIDLLRRLCGLLDAGYGVHLM